MSRINRLTKVDDSVTVHRYENGWMVEISGRDNTDEYKSSKIVCNTQEELFALITDYNNIELVG